MNPDTLTQIKSIIGRDLLGPVSIATIGAVAMYFSPKIRRFSKKILWKFFKIKEKNDQFLTTTEKNQRVQELLIELRIKLNADRTFLAMFSNGDHFIDGSDIQKVSRTNESVGPGVAFEALHYQNINISLINHEMELVKEPGPSFRLVSQLKDGKFKRMLVARGVKAIARCAVRNNDKIIGYIGLSFHHELEKPANIDEVCTYAGLIEQILSEYR